MSRWMGVCRRVLVGAALSAMAVVSSVSVDVGGVHTAAAAPAPPPVGWTAGAFVPLRATRVLDTITGFGVAKAAVAPGSVTVAQILGRGGVPTSGVSSVVVNITARSGTSTGAVYAAPHGGRVPVGAQVRYRPVAATSSLATVAISDGRIDLFNQSAGTVHLQVDVVGYHVAGAARLAGTFSAVAPARLYDSRTGVGRYGQARTPLLARTYDQTQVAGRGGVPTADVAAVVLSVTATAATSAGSLVVYPSDGPTPTSSTASYGASSPVTTQVVTRLGADGRLSLRNNGADGSVHVVIDVVGWYGKPSISADVIDATVTGATRTVAPFAAFRSAVSAPEAPGATRSVKVLGRGGVPSSGVSAVHVSLTVLTATKPGSLAAYRSGGAAPAVPNLYFPAATRVTNSAIVPVGADGAIVVANRSGGSAQVLVVITGYVVERAVSVNVLESLDRIYDPLSRVACTSETFCVAMDRFGAASMFDGVGWSAPRPVLRAEARALDCAGVAFCLAVAQGVFAVFNGQSWKVTAEPFGPLMEDVSCGSATHCVGVGGGEFRIFDGASWGPSKALPTLVDHVDCVSVGWCVAVGATGYFTIWSGGRWTKYATGAGYPGDIACDGVGSCVGTGTGSSPWILSGTTWAPLLMLPTPQVRDVTCLVGGACAVLTTNVGLLPIQDGSVTSVVPTPAEIDGAVSCPTSTWCMGIGRSGWASALDVDTWSSPRHVAPGGPLQDNSCPTPTWCMAVGPYTAQVVAAGVPQALRLLPPIVNISGTRYAAVACSSPTFCLAAGESGGAATWDGTAWTAQPATGPISPHWVECPADGVCMVAAQGMMAKYDHGTWSMGTVGHLAPADSIGCWSVNGCINPAVAGDAHVFDGTTWGALAAQSFDARATDCVSATFCLTVGALSGAGRSAVFDGTAWTETSIGMIGASVSCVSSTWCAAVDGAGRIAVFDGSAWSPPQAVTGSISFPLTRFRLDCPSVGRCLLVAG